MITKPNNWDDLWGSDGTRCSYQILVSTTEPPPDGTYMRDQIGTVWQITSISSTEMTILRVTDESLFDRVLYACDKAFFTFVGNSMSTSIKDVSWFLLYTGDNDIEEESLILDKPVFTAAKPIGNTPCFTMECCLRQKGLDIPKGAWLELQTRLQNVTKVTNWVSLGKFKVNKRFKYPDGWVKLLCRDRMQMANQVFLKDESVDVTTWPKPMSEVMSASLDIMGITLDPSTVINEGDAWVVPLPIGLSIRAIWSSIAAAHGGNFIITPQDTLKLIRPKAAEDADLEVELSEEGFELLGEPVTVDRLTLSTNELHIMAGDSGDNNVNVECLYASADAALYAKSQLEGPLYTPVKCADMVFDPLGEVYDTFLVNGVLTTWSQLTIKCGIVPLADGVSDTSAEPASEYGFEDTPLNEIKSQIKAVTDSIDAADRDAFEKITQEQLFNKLTNNGEVQGVYFQEGQIFINASYMRSGTLMADLIKAGTLQSSNGSFRLNLDTGELSVSNYATSREMEIVEGSLAQQGDELSSVKSDVITLKADSGDLAVTIQKVIDEGASKVVTSMGYCFTDEGLRIKKPGEEIDNMLDHTGMYVFRGSEVMLQANNLGVVATDVSVRNYLIIGNHSRLEDYNDGQDSIRTALFHLS